MPGNDIGIEIRGGAQLERIIKSLKEVGDGGLATELRTELRKAARPMVPAVRRAIKQIPSSAKDNGRLRAAMAAATRVQFRSAGTQAGVTIRVDGRKMPSGMRSLPAYMEGRKPRWRHPVFDSTGTRWAKENQPAHPYFYETVVPLGLKVGKDINTIGERIARKLTE